MIEIQNLTKRYGDKYAVKNASFTIKKGEVLGFLGRNGAGKTTTMNIITGYISSSEGRVLVDGYDILKDPQEVKRRIGYLPEHPPLYLEMTVDEYMRFSCDIKGVQRNKQRKHMDEIYELVGLTDMRKRLTRNLSKGYRQRVGLAQALVGNPDVLIFDEPTVGLDPRQIIEIRKLVKDLGRGHTVVLSSHILHEVADICERLVIINRGEIVAQDTLQNLIQGVGETMRLTARVAGPEKQVLKLLHELYGIKYIEAIGSMEPETVDYILESSRDNDIRKAMFSALAKAGYPILMMKPTDVTLEDIFLKLTAEDEKEVM